MMLYVGLAGALLVGVMLGLLGGGGSILMVPLLVYVLGVEPRTAIAMSLVVVGVTSASGALFHARAGRVRWRIALVFGAGGMVGAFLGGKLNPLLAPDTLLLLFAGVMVAAAVAMLLRTEAPAPVPVTTVAMLLSTEASAPTPVTVLARSEARATPMAVVARSEARATPVAVVARSEARATPESTGKVLRVLAQGVGVGMLSGLVGAGGGFLIVPALALVGLSTPMATATSLVVIALQCAAGLVGHLGHLELPWRLTGEVLGVALMGSLLGGKLSGRVTPGALRRGFALFVLATATFLLLSQLPMSVRTHLPGSAGAGPWVVATGLGLAFAGWRLRAVRQGAARGH